MRIFIPHELYSLLNPKEKAELRVILNKVFTIKRCYSSRINSDIFLYSEEHLKDIDLEISFTLDFLNKRLDNLEKVKKMEQEVKEAKELKESIKLIKGVLNE